jgi:hypothetical protein
MSAPPADETICIVFSKDRALQLDATLRSLAALCAEGEAVRPSVLFAATTDVDRRQYAELAEAHRSVRFVAETSFQSDLLGLLKAAPFVLFLVDDTLFTAPWRLGAVCAALRVDERLIGVSLRLGRNVTWCYAHGIPQAMPPALPVAGDIVAFPYAGNVGDFGYPLEVSSSVYRAEDIATVLAGTRFRNPNTLETALSLNRSRLGERRPLLASFTQSVAFSNPVNIVQSEYPNRSGQSAEWSAATLRRLFDAGLRIDVDAYRGLATAGCHEERPLRFIRPTVAGPVATRVRAAVESLARSAFLAAPGAAETAPPELSDGDIDILCLLGLFDRLARDPGPDPLLRFAGLAGEMAHALEQEVRALRATLRKTQVRSREQAERAARAEASLREFQGREDRARTAARVEAIALGATVADLRRQLDEVQRSLTWRLTHPLRNVHAALRSMERRLRAVRRSAAARHRTSALPAAGEGAEPPGR